MDNIMDIKFHLLEDITNNFSEELKVGSGGYGDVYKGTYKGEYIAVKKLHHFQGLDDKGFDSECRNLSRVNHPNVVRLLRYCYESNNKYIRYNGELVFAKTVERVLCFEFMEGGDLDKHIKEKSCDLDWPTCYQIIKGTSEGLNHLHSVQHKPIYHLDLKPANVLLDKNMMAKIGDLGLSRIFKSTETHKTEIINVKGTLGYMPPEYIDGGYISKKFDVFSLGVIILKILTGNKGYYRCYEMSPGQFTNNVTIYWERRLQGTSRYSSHEEDILQVRKCVEIALKCVEKDRTKRPCINDIVHELRELDAHSKTSSGSNVLSVDPSKELRFLFEPRKDASSCLQLINMTNGSIAFGIKTNKLKYWTVPETGVMAPYSKRYICVRLQAQEDVPENMQCDDTFIVQSACVSEDLTSDEITDDFFKEGKVDVMKLPIIYVAANQFPNSKV